MNRMKTSHPQSRALPFSIALLLAGCGVAHADELPPLEASATARSAGPWQPDFSEAVSPPMEPSPAPARAEWTEATVAREARVTDPSCSVKRIREWVRVECRFNSAIERISGPTKDVSFGCFNASPDTWGCDVGSVTFPMRRGDRVAFQSFRPTKWGSAADTFITAQFLDGDEVPLISVQGIRSGV